MAADDLVELGCVAGVFGVKGWIKIKSWTDPAENILSYKTWILHKDNLTQAWEVEAARIQGKMIVAKLEGLDDREHAELLKGQVIAVPRSALPKLAKNEYYWRDLEGMQVINADGTVFGTVEYLIATGANDVLVIGKGENEVLIPFLQESVIKRVDLKSKEIHVDWDTNY